MRVSDRFVLLLLFFLAAPLQLAAFDWDSIPAGRWVDIPTVGDAAPKVFHGGATLAAERSEVFFFGSDTHAPTPLENGESNSVWRLNLETLCWSRDYEQDPKSTYRILPDSQTVTTTGRPWAMHTFDCVEWDPVVGRMVVVHHPVHVRFEMAERFPMFHGDWNLSLKSSHWEYDPATITWQRFNSDPPDLFARALTRNPETGQLIATDGARTWTFDRAAARWITHQMGTAGGWHLKLAFDTYARQALLLGNNQSSGVLYAWDPVKLDWRTVEVNRQPLPANGAAMAYDTRNHVLLYLANDCENQYHNPTGKAVTFIYHSEGQRWERLEIESPELYGMNYLTQYDPVRNVFLHFERSPASTGERLRVWAFRYR